MASFTTLDSIKDDSLILPPDVSAKNYRTALIEIAKVVGDENVTIQTGESR